MQYERNEIDFSRGKFRVRGDVIDIFPAESSEHALRLTLFDDEVETLSLFDPLTGHILQKVPRFTVYPSSHYVTPRETTLCAIETIKVGLAERIAFCRVGTVKPCPPYMRSASAMASRITRATFQGARQASRRRRPETMLCLTYNIKIARLNHD
jgi:hypothetical protein